MAPKTIITGIEAFPVCVPYKTGRKSDASAWGDRELPAANSLLVKVTPDSGLEGWGGAFGLRAVASAKLALDDLIARFASARTQLGLGLSWWRFQKPLHVFGRSGSLAYGVSAVDIALWDLAGRLANVPVC